MLVLHLAIRISQKGIEPSDTIYSEDRQNARRRENVGGRPSLARTTSSCASQVTPIIPQATPKNAAVAADMILSISAISIFQPNPLG
jgi:hypothetical protein